ncbi:pyruvate dehydrogenase E1 (lipoamide) subunit beta [Neobacillus bataviensis LMG 21833]|uniref:Pyruvate dehydrogenase E1 (Lipoamide) subunit beta n=1 Tax=Neobacillus bataviensis LMG 21833 TaxID=1117379 RepID=K6DS65_9BACI|nr:alpha-ketoacid dehydrogenase subunit beta [Neobacillus bataviensis]EKN71073.1 pyruvate dehydrogenase E1 (lipoamide) subunit beta [Neobacillus bataviensis LMG 21833]
MTTMTMIEAINFTLRKEMERDQRVICIGEDIGKNGGVFRATDGLQALFGEERVVDTPIAESAIVGTAVGMASRGLRPVAEIQFFGFIYEAMDQMVAQAARLRFRSGGTMQAPMVVRAPFGGGVRTPELHSDSLEGLFLHSPGMKVVMPSNAYDAKGLLTSAIRDNDPVLFLEPMKLYRAFKQEVPTEDYCIEIGKANVLKEGEDLTIITWGPTVPLVSKVVEQWEKQTNTSVELIDLRTISPIDEETILASVQKTGRAIIVHEAVKTGGPGAEISALINEKALFHLTAPIIRVTGFDTPYPVPSVEDEWLPNANRIIQGIKEVFAH